MIYDNAFFWSLISHGMDFFAHCKSYLHKFITLSYILLQNGHTG